MKCFPLSEGTYTVDQSKNFIPFNSEIDSVKDRPGSLLVEICPFLIISDEGLIIIDPGLGLKNAEGEFQIIKNLSRLGYNSTDINFVLLSHLHKDHIGGVAYEENGEMKPMFPNAEYVYQEEEMNEALSVREETNRGDHLLSKKISRSFDENKLLFLKNRKEKIELKGNTKLLPRFVSSRTEIYCEVSGGHTKNHQVFWIDLGNEKYFYGGDVLPQGSQLIRKFAAKYDYDGKESGALRIQYGKKCAEENYACLFFHSSINPISKVKYEDGIFELIPY